MSTPPPSEIDVNMKEIRQGCPDEKTEHYLKYIRGIKGRKPPGGSIVSVIELHPKGYPQLAAVIDSDEQFMLYRRFGFCKYDFCSINNTKCEHGEYRKLLAEIEKKYNEYDTAALSKPLDALYILYYSSSNIRDIDAIYKGAHADNHPLNQELRQKTNPDTTGIFLFDPDRVNAVASIVLLATVPALFIIPVCTLWYLCQIKRQLQALPTMV
ncbi:hypothetical protein BofuT4_P083420.1 [Botrytis cinerea T4]|uniref:Uncharacterized protein n=1 Tax=Botryotinia fuckeliana (strain T4) TaxID=999810 RepID=G2YJZ1_BOTF4|nr:hypothetical protein BofuT4_P083420.1 [Botrytis cinerea T4]